MRWTQTIQSQVFRIASKRWVRRLGYLAFVVVTCGLLGLAGFGIWRWNAELILDDEKAKIVARGEPLWFSDLAPAPVKPEDDATPLLLAALAKFQGEPDGFWNLVAPPAPPGDYPLLRSTLEANRETLDLLAQAVRKPHCRLPGDYTSTSPFRISLKAVQDERSLARVLAGDTLQSIATGDRERAVAAVEEGLDLAELLREEPFVICQMFRRVHANKAIRSLERALGYIELTPDQFNALDDRLAEMDRAFAMRPAFLAERAKLLTMMDNITAEEIEAYRQDTGYKQLPVPKRPWKSRFYKPVLMREQAFMLRTMSELAEVIDEPGPAANTIFGNFDATFPDTSKEFPLTAILLPRHIPAAARDDALRHHNLLMTARLGIRVARFRSEHKMLPDSLSEVLDDRLPSLPLDRFSGKPPVYRALADGFMIYPLGENGIDDGGGMQPDIKEYAGKFEVRYP